MYPRRIERGSYEFIVEKESSKKSFKTIAQTYEEFLKDNEIVTKDKTLITTYSSQPKRGDKPEAESIPNIDTFEDFASKEIQANYFEPLRNVSPFDAEIQNNAECGMNEEHASNGQSSEAAFNVDMGEESMFKKGNTGCKSKEFIKTRAENIPTVVENINTSDTGGGGTNIKMKTKAKFEMGNTNCVDDKEVDIQANDCILDTNMGRGKKPEPELKVDMDAKSHFKMGDTDCTTKERQKIVTDKFVAEGTLNGESKSKMDIRMKKKAELDMGNRNCEKVKEVDIHNKASTNQVGPGLPQASGGNININMGKNSSLKGSISDLKEEDGTHKVADVTVAIVESLSEFEDILRNHARTVKRMCMKGDWINDLDEFTLENCFKTLHQLVNLQIRSKILSDMPPISCLDRLRSLDVSDCKSISATSVLRELSCVKRPLKKISMASCTNFRYKELLDVACYVKNAEVLDIRHCCRLCPIQINDILEKTNIQTLKVTKCSICRDCVELKGEIGDHIKDLDRVEFGNTMKNEIYPKK